jgi:hypothetical protein
MNSALNLQTYKYALVEQVQPGRRHNLVKEYYLWVQVTGRMAIIRKILRNSTKAPLQPHLFALITWFHRGMDMTPSEKSQLLTASTVEQCGNTSVYPSLKQ